MCGFFVNRVEGKEMKDVTELRWPVCVSNFLVDVYYILKQRYCMGL